MAEHWLSIIEYARTFGISDMTVRRRIKTGKLKAVLKDGKYFIPQGEGALAGKMVAESEKSVSGNSGPAGHSGSGGSGSGSLEMQKPVATGQISQPFFGGTAKTAPLPSHLRQDFSQKDKSLVDAKSLLQFCEHALAKLEASEGVLERKYIAIVSSLETKIQYLQGEVDRYKQQVEDLQLLVKVVEQKADKT